MYTQRERERETYINCLTTCDGRLIWTYLPNKLLLLSYAVKDISVIGGQLKINTFSSQTITIVPSFILDKNS